MTDSPQTLRVLQENPVDEFVLAEEKFLELEASSPEHQAEVFARRWVFVLDVDGIRGLMKIREDFEVALVNHWTGGGFGSMKTDLDPVLVQAAARKFSVSSNKSGGSALDVLDNNYLPLASTSFTAFLEKRGKAMAQLYRKNAFKGVTNKVGGITLLGYLLYHYRRKILIQYFGRRGANVTKDIVGLQCGKDLGNDTIGYELNLHGVRKTVADGLKEETLIRLPIGVDDLLDEGLQQFQEFILPVRKSIYELGKIVADEHLSTVKRNAAKTELASVKSQYVEAHMVSFNKMKPRIEKLEKDQEQKYASVMKEVRGKIKYRQMTLVKNTKA